MKFYNLLMLLIFISGTKSFSSCGIPYSVPSTSNPPGTTSGIFSPNGSYVACANFQANTVTLFTVTEGVLNAGTTYSLPSGSIGPISVAFSPDSAHLASGNSNSNDVTIFSVSNGALGQGVSYPLPTNSFAPNSVAFSPNGAYLATANYSSVDVTVFQVTAGALSGGTSTPVGSNLPYVLALAFSPDSSLLATANGSSNTSDGSVTVFTVGAGGALNTGTSYPLPSGSISPCSLAFTPNGSFLATANAGNDPANVGDITVFAVNSGTLSSGTSYPLPAGCSVPNSVAISPSGTLLAVDTNESNNIALYTLTGGVLSNGNVYDLPLGCANPASVAFSPNSLYLANTNVNAGYDTVTIFDISSCANPTVPPTTVPPTGTGTGSGVTSSSGSGTAATGSGSTASSSSTGTGTGTAVTTGTTIPSTAATSGTGNTVTSSTSTGSSTTGISSDAYRTDFKNTLGVLLSLLAINALNHYR